MLAQGQSSSAKRGLAVVSSGIIFLKKKKRDNITEKFEDIFHKKSRRPINM